MSRITTTDDNVSHVDFVRKTPSYNTMLASHEEIVKVMGFTLAHEDIQFVKGKKYRRRYWLNDNGELYIFEVKDKRFAGTVQLQADTLDSIKRWIKEES